MTIVSWFTIIGLIIAIFGFLIKDELKIFMFKLHRWEYRAAVAVLVVIIPFLLFFDALSKEYPFFQLFTVAWGWQAQNVAFFLFYVVFIWSLMRLLCFPRRRKVNESIISTYIQILEESHAFFWKVFKRYENVDFVKAHWLNYNDLVFHPKFLESALEYTIAKKIIDKYPKISSFNSKKIAHYQQLLESKQFERFWRLFTKFEKAEEINKNWHEYEHIFLNPLALNNLMRLKECSLLFEVWHNFDDSRQFKQLFITYLGDVDSRYYVEVRGFFENYEKWEDLKSYPFLNCILNTNLRQSMDNNLLGILSEYASEHLKIPSVDVNIVSHPLPESINDFFDQPIYYHIFFINVMYAFSISQGIDIGGLSNKFINRQTIYSAIAEDMISNMKIMEEDLDKEYPTKYHWLISRAFNYNSSWLTKFNEDEFFRTNSSYPPFFVDSVAFCLNQLYKGYKKGKIKLDFIIHTLHYHVLADYYGLRDELKTKIEEKVIRHIPKSLVESVFDFSLDDSYAISHNDLMASNFDNHNSTENRILERLREFLESIID